MRLTSAIPVLRVADYAAARVFWTETMGFALGEEGGEPPRFGTFHQGAATVFVDAWHGADSVLHAGWRAYFHCSDVDAMALHLAGRGYPFEGPANAVYGMRELTLRDPAGNLLCFGQELPAASAES